MSLAPKLLLAAILASALWSAFLLSPDRQSLASRASISAASGGGLVAKPTVLGKPANKRQRAIAKRLVVLGARYDHARPLQALLQAATVESAMGTRGMRRPIDGDSLGVLQGRLKYHSARQLRSLSYNVRTFMTKSFSRHPSGGAVAMARAHPNWSPGRIAAANLGTLSAPQRYQQWANEARTWIRLYQR